MIERQQHLQRVWELLRTHPMHAARASLGLGQIDLIHAVDYTFPLADGIRAVACSRLFSDIEPL